MSEPEMHENPSPVKRRRVWIYTIPALVLLVLAGFFYRGLQINPAFIESPLVGQRAPTFSLPNLLDPEGQVGTEDIAGRYALLNVWGSWCPECYHEHEFLTQLSEAGMPIYGFNYNDERADALEFLDTMGNPYVAIAADEIGNVAIDWGIYGAPETFLLSPDLTILHKHIGPLTPAIWERDFVPALESHRERS